MSSTLIKTFESLSKRIFAIVLALAQEFHALRKNAIHSARIPCVPKEFHPFHRISMHFDKNSMYSTGITCIPPEFHAFRKNSMHPAGVLCIPQVFHAFRQENYVEPATVVVEPATSVVKPVTSAMKPSTTVMGSIIFLGGVSRIFRCQQYFLWSQQQMLRSQQ